MPIISMFYGIVIRMYFPPKEHDPPHIHAYYQDYQATFKIRDALQLSGKMPVKQTRIIQAWIEIREKIS